VHALKTAQDDFGIVRSAERKVQLRDLVAVDVTRVSNLDCNGVEVFPEARVAAVGA